VATRDAVLSGWTAGASEASRFSCMKFLGVLWGVSPAEVQRVSRRTVSPIMIHPFEIGVGFCMRKTYLLLERATTGNPFRFPVSAKEASLPFLNGTGSAC